ncbi:MAG: PIN domain-containing protein [Opitutaceae bacterium]|jgi:tRNA(fMet)-specific endonuclease VapC|nr:PIN domain-containing protein [Opitutaceae bacterium]
MNRYLPDTNVYATYAKGEDAALIRKVDAHMEDLALSTIALAEMEYGWQKAPMETRRIARQKALVAKLEPKPFDQKCANLYGRIKVRMLHRQTNAHPIGERDMLLAAHALAIGAVLVTHNTREFSAIPGLDVEDWQA